MHRNRERGKTHVLSQSHRYARHIDWDRCRYRGTRWGDQKTCSARDRGGKQAAVQSDIDTMKIKVLHGTPATSELNDDDPKRQTGSCIEICSLSGVTNRG